MRDKPGIGQFPRAYHQVKRLGDEIDPARRDIHFQFNIRKLRGELRQERREEFVSKIDRQRQAQHPARQRVLPMQLRMNEARLLDQRQGTLQIEAAGFRQLDFARGAVKNAIKAGFDGVEFYAANGYLPQQFLADSSNQRNDEYGGSIENKARFTLEAMQAIIAAIGGDKVGIKISPLHPYAGIAFDDPVATYRYLIGELNKLDFSFVEIMKRSPMFPLLPHNPQADELELFGTMVEKTLIAGTGYTAESGEKELEKGIADLIAFGAPFLANPDLPRRFALGAELNAPDRATMFGGGAQGYIDYPFLP